MATPITVNVKVKDKQLPYTIKIGRQLADHTTVDVLFNEVDDERAKHRIQLIWETLDQRLQDTNRRILDDSAWIEAQRKAIRAEEHELIRAEMLNELRNQGLIQPAEATHANGADRPAVD